MILDRSLLLVPSTYRSLLCTVVQLYCIQLRIHDASLLVVSVPARVDLHLAGVPLHLVVAILSKRSPPAVPYNKVINRILRDGRRASANDDVGVVHGLSGAVGNDAIFVTAQA